MTIENALSKELVNAIKENSCSEQAEFLEWEADSCVGYDCRKIDKLAEVLNMYCCDYPEAINYDELAHQCLVFAHG